MEPNILLVHPYGAPFVEGAATALAEKQQLSGVVTSLAFQKDSVAGRIPYVGRYLARRLWIPAGVRVFRVMFREVTRLVTLRLSTAHRTAAQLQALSDVVYEGVDRRAAAVLSRSKEGTYKGVYAYEDGAREVFIEAMRRGAHRIYDLPILYYREILRREQEEAVLFPEVKSGFLSLSDPVAKREKKDAELGMATHIIVASECTRQSLLGHGITNTPISVVPYGVTPPKKWKRRALCSSGDLSVVFLGRVAPRKGVHRLLRVWNTLRLPRASLTLAGIIEMPREFLAKEVQQSNGSIEVTGPLTAIDVEDLLARTDLLVLPSLAEGFGMVLLEAMVRGIPVVATDATALPELIGSSSCGRVIPSRDSGALSDALVQLSDERSLLTARGEECHEIAHRFTWQRYRKLLSEQLGYLQEK